MIFPIGDSPNPEGTPYVTYALIAINVAVYVLVLPLSWTAPDPTDPALQEYIHLVARQTGYTLSPQQILARTSAYDLFVFEWGYRPVAPSLLHLFTSMFLHGGLGHLAGNMLFLWIYGDNVEHRLGGRRYLAAYLATGAAATLFHAMFSPNSGLPLVGASGAISGVLGFYFLWFPRNRVHLLLLFPFLVRLTVSARTLLGLYVIVENLLPFVISGGAGGIAHGAHIGGFVAGLGIAYWMDRKAVQGQPSSYAGENAEGNGDRVRAWLQQGRLDDAATEYFALAPEATERLLEPREMLQLASWLVDAGHPEAALVLYRRQLRDYPTGPMAADAYLGAGLIQLRAGQATAAYQHFLDALESKPTPEIENAAREALRAIGRHQGRKRPLVVP